MAFFTVVVFEAHRAASIHQIIFFFFWGGAGSLVAHVVKNAPAMQENPGPPAMQEDLGSIPGLERFPGEGYGNPFQ